MILYHDIKSIFSALIEVNIRNVGRPELNENSKMFRFNILKNYYFVIFSYGFYIYYRFDTCASHFRLILLIRTFNTTEREVIELPTVVAS